MFRVILLDHSKIEAGDLQMMQFGSFDARVKRIKGALEEGKYWWEDLDVPTKPEIEERWLVTAEKMKERVIMAGDAVIDEGGKIWMKDYTGWENVSKQLSKPLQGEIKMFREGADGVDTIPKTDVVVKKQKDRAGSDQEKNMPGTQNGVTAAADEVVMLPPAEINETSVDDEDEGEEILETKPVEPKKRGRKPGSKNKPKAEVVAKPATKKAAAGKALAKKAAAKPVAKKAAGKIAAKPAKAAKAAKPAKKAAKAAGKTRRHGISGVKAQTQVAKAAFAEILRRAKEADCTAADIVRAAVYKFIGYKPEQE